MTRICRNLLTSALVLGHLPIALASTTLYVNGASGSDTDNCMSVQTACKTIGHAISVASSGNSVMVAAGTYTENIVIGFSLNLIGSGASTTIIDGGNVNSVVTISSASADVRVSHVTITHGKARIGAGIVNHGTLTINSSTISGNSASASTACRGGDCSGYGGGIANAGTGTLTINNSTISGNLASGSCGGQLFPWALRCWSVSNGGGISNSGKLTMNNSTLSGNGVQATCRYSNGHLLNCVPVGGGIASIGPVAINNSTISGNSAHALCFELSRNDCRADVGGLYNFVALYEATIQNSIVSSNVGRTCYWTEPYGCPVSSNVNVAGNCYVIKSDGYNLSSDGTCYFDNAGDLNHTDPKLGPLQNNGGPTETMALSSGSPAIDAGNPSGCTDGLGHLLKTDQRGMPRPDREDKSGCDRGAYEHQGD